MIKTDNVKVAVWVSAAILTFNEYNEKDGDVYFRQTDIQRMAEKLCSKDVASARIGQWYNGDHANNTYNFLRSKGSLRRLTKFGEFNGVKEYPEELLEYFNELVTVRNFEKISVKDLFSWVREVYSANVKEIQAEEIENKLELFNFDNTSYNEYGSRMDLIISQSWEILKSQFIGYLSRNKANDIINNIFIFLLEGGLKHKNVALDALMKYYYENKYPRMIGSKLAMLLNNIIVNDKELKEKAILIANESGLYKKNNELKNNIAGSTAAITGE